MQPALHNMGAHPGSSNLIITDAEIHQNSEGTRLIEEEDYLNL